MEEIVSDIVKSQIPVWLSTYIMQLGKQASYKSINLASLRYNPKDVAQNTYLTDRATQKKYFKKQGYTEDKSGNYGLVKKAVGDRKLPIYQTRGLSVDSDNIMQVSIPLQYTLTLKTKNSISKLGI